MSVSNKVTERPHVGSKLYLVSAEWRGGHDMRIIRLQNIHDNEVSAKTDWERLTPENHNRNHGFPIGADRGFRRFPIRVFVEAGDV